MNQRISFAADKGCIAQLYQLDYSARMAEIIARSEELRGPEGVRAFASENLVIDPADKSLTVSDQAIVNGLYFKSRRPGERLDEEPRHTTTMSASTLAYFAEDFYRSEDRLPASGAELVLFIYPELNTVAGMTAFCEKSWKEQLLALGYCINPATGRIHGSLLDSTWSPGGVYIRRASSEEVRSDRPVLDRILNSISGERPESRIVTYFGKEPGTVLAREFRTRVAKDSAYFKHPEVQLPGNTPLPDRTQVVENPCHGSNPCNPCNPCGQ